MSCKSYIDYFFSFQSDYDEERGPAEYSSTKPASAGFANSFPRGFRLGRPLSIDESRIARRGSLGAGLLTTAQFPAGAGNTGYHTSTTNALTLGESSNLQRVRHLLGQSAPSLSANLVSNFTNFWWILRDTPKVDA